MSPNPLLSVNRLIKTFNGVKALDGVSFDVRPGEILGLVGPNGSGKTTCINVISGLYKPDGGTIHFRDELVAGLSMARLTHRGISRTFQIPKPFKTLSVADNVELARHYGRPQNPVVDDPLEFVGLADLKNQPASALTSSQQKLLDLARALATGPQLLLVDELAAGLNPMETDALATKLRELAQRGVALVVVEHLLQFVNQLTQRVIVMNAGREIFEGTLAEASTHSEVVKVYLGG